MYMHTFFCVLRGHKVGWGCKGDPGRGGGFWGKIRGITGVRTAGSLIFLGNNNNDGLGEEFSRIALIAQIYV